MMLQSQHLSSTQEQQYKKPIMRELSGTDAKFWTEIHFQLALHLLQIHCQNWVVIFITGRSSETNPSKPPPHFVKWS